MGKWKRNLSLPRRWQRNHLISKYGAECYLGSTNDIIVVQHFGVTGSYTPPPVQTPPTPPSKVELKQPPKVLQVPKIPVPKPDTRLYDLIVSILKINKPIYVTVLT